MTMVMIKCFDLKKKKEKNKKLKTKMKLDRSFLVWWSTFILFSASQLRWIIFNQISWVNVQSKSDAILNHTTLNVTYHRVLFDLLNIIRAKPIIYPTSYTYKERGKEIKEWLFTHTYTSQFVNQSNWNGVFNSLCYWSFGNFSVSLHQSQLAGLCCPS